MKFFFLVLLSVSLAQAMTWELKGGSAAYGVKHLLKTVTGESHSLKGKIQCQNGVCEFLVAAPVTSFVSGDGNRDENMKLVTEAAKFPWVLARGKLAEDKLSARGEFSVPVEIEFHGKKSNYHARVLRGKDERVTAALSISLEAHGVERPSLFGVKIEDAVPLTLNLDWNTGR